MKKGVGKLGPDFICIGAMKSGTTWLYTRLRELPDFELLPVKETHYFDRSDKYLSPNKLTTTRLSDRIKNFSWLKMMLRHLFLLILKGKWKRFRWYKRWYLSTYDDQWYLSIFSSTKGITGEVTPAYAILEREDISRMQQLVPKVRLVYILRCPIERAWSHYRFCLAKGNRDIKDEKSIIDFLDSKEQEIRTEYLKTIENYLEFFSNQQLLVCYYDAIEDNPKSFMQEVVSFIGGEPDGVSTYCNLDEKNLTSIKMMIPDAIKHHLMVKYKDIMKELSNQFGGYCTKWYDMYFGKD